MVAKYVLAVHSRDGEVREPMSPEVMQHSWQQIGVLDAEMKSSGAWVLSGWLHDADTATVVRVAKTKIS